MQPTIKTQAIAALAFSMAIPVGANAAEVAAADDEDLGPPNVIEIRLEVVGRGPARMLPGSIITSVMGGAEAPAAGPVLSAGPMPIEAVRADAAAPAAFEAARAVVIDAVTVEAVQAGAGPVPEAFAGPAPELGTVVAAALVKAVAAEDFMRVAPELLVAPEIHVGAAATSVASHETFAPVENAASLSSTDTLSSADVLAVPEPATVGLLGLGILGIGLGRIRRR